MIELTDEQKDIIAGQLKAYMLTEHDLQMGRFEVDDLIDFIAAKAGAHFYNKGVFDTMAAIGTKLEEVSDIVFDLEQPLD